MVGKQPPKSCTPLEINPAIVPRESSPDWAARSLLRDRRALAVGLSISLCLHVLGYWLAPGLKTAWKDGSIVAYALSLTPRLPPRDEPKSKPRAERRSARPAPQPSPLPPEITKSINESSIDFGSSGLESATDMAPEILGESLQKSLGALPRVSINPEVARPVSPTAGSHPPGTGRVAEFELPSSVSIAFSARSSITDGVAHYSWKREGGQYETQSTLQATGFFVNMFAGVLHQVSRGSVTTAGLAPDAFHLRRGDNAPDTAEFARTASELRLSRAGGSPRAQPLPAAIQDTQSFVFHLAYLLAQIGDTGRPIELMVTNARKVYRYRFQIMGVGPIETPLGVVETVHLKSEAADPTDAYEVWLAPSYYNLPVRLKFFAGRFPIELIATSIGSER